MKRGSAAGESAAIMNGVGESRPLGLAESVRSAMRGVPALCARYRVLTFETAIALGALALALVHPALSREPTLRVTLETAMTMLAIGSVLLLILSFVHSRRLSDVLLASGVMIIGLTYFCVYSLPLIAQFRMGVWLSGAAMWGAVFAAAAFSAAARASTRVINTGLRGPILLAGGGAAAAVLAAALMAAVSAELLGRALPGHWRVVVLAVIGATLFVDAAIGSLRSVRGGDAGVRLLPAALILLAVVQLSHLALPWPRPDEVALSDGLRLVALGFVLVVAAGEARRAHALAAEALSAAERQRVASDLHDGLVQDLAFIAAYGERFTGHLGAEHPMVIAARRALDVSRGAIAELAHSPGASAEQALNAVADDVGARFGIVTTVDVEVEREPAAEIREHLSRITREAITNAGRHGRARTVNVTLRATGGGITLTVRDDGCGLTSARSTGADGGGFGLTSIRKRAGALGGSVSIGGPDGGGTTLEVVLP